jgi:O-antigen/teichoic acid export membrane protein
MRSVDGVRQWAGRLGYAPLLVCATGLLFCKNIAYARILPVAGFGSLSQAAFLAGAFVAVAGGGLPLLGQKVLPQYYARAEADAAAGLLLSAIMAYIAASAVSTIALVVALSIHVLQSPAWWFALLIYAGAQYLFALKLIAIKSKLRFESYARLSVARSVALVVVGVATAWALHSVAAVLVAEGCVTLLMILPLRKFARSPATWMTRQVKMHNWSWLRSNMKFAIRLLWLNGVFVVLFGIDRWAALSLLDDHAFGIYAIGLTVITVFEAAQSIVNVAVYPLMSTMFGRGAVVDAFRLATTATAIVVVAALVLYFPFGWFLDVLLLKYLPAYAAASAVLKIAVLAGSLRLADFFCTFAILCDREIRLTRIFAFEILAIASSVAILKFAFGLTFDPTRMAYVALTVAALALATNTVVALTAFRQVSSGRPGR